jgi:hypothetical protein
VIDAVAWLEDTYARGERRHRTIGLADLRTYVHRARRWPWVRQAGAERQMFELLPDIDLEKWADIEATA